MIEFLSAFFIISGMWVWFWTATCFLLVLAFSEHEKNYWAFITVGAFVAVMQHSDIISIFADPVGLLIWAIGYFILGGVWSFVKWFSYVNTRARLFGEVKLKYIEEINTKSLDDKLEVDIKTKIPDVLNFNKYLNEWYFNYSHRNVGYVDENRLDHVIPSASNNKEKIVTWILWWPTSMIWTLLNDPLVRFANWMYDKFHGLYKRIATAAFSKFDV